MNVPPRVYRSRPSSCWAIAPFLLPNYQSQLTELWLFVVFALTWDLIGGQTGYNSFGNVLFIGVGTYACAVTQIGLVYSVSRYTGAAGGHSTIFIFTAANISPAWRSACRPQRRSPARRSSGAWCWACAGTISRSARSGLVSPPGRSPPVLELDRSRRWAVVAQAPAALGDLSELFYYLSFGLAVARGVPLAAIDPLRAGAQRHPRRRGQGRGHGPADHLDQGDGLGLAAVLLGMSGGILGNLKRFIDPIDVAFAGETYGLWMVLMAILGGKGTIWGPVIGAAIFQVLKEVFWIYLFGWQRVALGLMIVVIVVFFPQGILGWARERFPSGSACVSTRRAAANPPARHGRRRNERAS